MTQRTVGAIALLPTGNTSDSVIFLNLSTGHTLIRDQFNILPIPSEYIRIIDKIQENAVFVESDAKTKDDAIQEVYEMEPDISTEQSKQTEEKSYDANDRGNLDEQVTEEIHEENLEENTCTPVHSTTKKEKQISGR